jgi:DNA-binding transcriptional LysR family regulator
LPSRLLYRQHYVAAVRSDHSLATRRTISLESFCSYDHVLVSPTGGSFEGSTDEALARIGKRRAVRYSVPNFLLVPELLQIGDLIAVVPSRLLRAYAKRLTIIKSPINIPGFDVIAVWHPRVDNNIAHRWLRTRLSQTASHIKPP